MQSVYELSEALRKRDISSVELTRETFRRIAGRASLNAFITLDEEEALRAASHADTRLKDGTATPLTGIPMAHKDIFCTKNLRTTCGSRMLASFIPPYDAAIVDNLREAGCILTGKTNMDEFAMGSAGDNSYFGPTRNPWNLACAPGGSSSGSAAAVAAGLVPFATGSDTGGSIRQPAAWCGISGLKPTWGRVSRYGMVAFASSFDQAGPMARSARDLAMTLSAMAGFDARDATSSAHPVEDYAAALEHPLKRLRIGLPSCFLNPDIAPGILEALQEVIRFFETRGCRIVPLELALEPLWAPCYYVIACAEASSNLARYDGVRFGHRAADVTSFRDMVTRSRTEGFGMEVQRRILTGSHVLSSGFYDDWCIQAQKIRTLIRKELDDAFRTVDVILGPTTPSLPCSLDEPVTNPVHRYLGDIFTVVANLAGLPALSMPAGFSEGLPVGVQWMAPAFREAELLSLAHGWQQHTDWHLAKPEIAEEPCAAKR